MKLKIDLATSDLGLKFEVAFDNAVLLVFINIRVFVFLLKIQCLKVNIIFEKKNFCRYSASMAHLGNSKETKLRSLSQVMILTR